MVPPARFPNHGPISLVPLHPFPWMTAMPPLLVSASILDPCGPSSTKQPGAACQSGNSILSLTPSSCYSPSGLPVLFPSRFLNTVPNAALLPAVLISDLISQGSPPHFHHPLLASDSVSSFLFLEPAKVVPTTGPLHMLDLLPELLCPHPNMVVSVSVQPAFAHYPG